jgi:hypothetical protein
MRKKFNLKDMVGKGEKKSLFKKQQNKKSVGQRRGNYESRKQNKSYGRTNKSKIMNKKFKPKRD